MNKIVSDVKFICSENKRLKSRIEFLDKRIAELKTKLKERPKRNALEKKIIDLQKTDKRKYAVLETKAHELFNPEKKLRLQRKRNKLFQDTFNVSTKTYYKIAKMYPNEVAELRIKTVSLVNEAGKIMKERR